MTTSAMTIKRVLFWLLIAFEVAIWPIGIWMMITASPDQNIEAIGRAMTTFIILAAIPLFALI